MDRDKMVELWNKGFKEIKLWTLRFTPNTSRQVKWPEAKADLMGFINQMDKDWEVWEMENKK